MTDLQVNLKTDQFKKILDVVKKGLGNGKVLPITEFIELLFTSNTLYVTSTNLTTWVTYKFPICLDIDEDDEVSVIVHGHKLVQLINKTTVSEITLTVNSDILYIEGNGTYTLPILQEEFPDYFFDVKDSCELCTQDLITSIELNKNSVAQDMVMPCLTGYYLCDKVITTNSIKMTVNNTNLLKSGHVLIPEEVANLVSILNDDQVTFESGDGNVLLSTSNITIFGPMLQGIEEYPNLDGILQTEFPGHVQVNIKTFKGILERLSIFNDPLNANGVRLSFDSNFIIITGAKGKNKELLNYTKKINFVKNQEILVNLDYLIQLLDSTPGEVVDLYFGDDNMIKLQGKQVMHFLCLMSDE